MQTTSTSPLNEVEQDSLAEVFARDPFQLSQQDIQKICTELRAQRQRWQSEDSTKSKGGRAPKVTLSSAEMDSILDSI